MKKSEITSFKKILLNLKAGTLAMPTAEVTPVSEIRGDDMDISTQVMQNEMQLKFSSRNALLVKEVNSALQRLENGTFGLCAECEEEIGKKRLEARPTTTLCISCKEQEERENASHSKATD